MSVSIRPVAVTQTVRFGLFEFALRAETESWLPRFKGSTLRGAFGSALKRAVCIRHDFDCDGCLVRPSCVYTHLFETLPPPGPNQFHNQQAVPRPFVIEPPMTTKQHYWPGERLRFGLTLIGRAMDYLPYVIFAIDQAGRQGLGHERGQFVLESVTCRGGDGDDPLIYDGAVKSLLAGPFSLSAEELISQRIPLLGPLNLKRSNLKLAFLTPARIRVHGDLQSGVTFELLVKSMLRRIWQVTSVHCGVELSLDHHHLIERAREVAVVRSQLRWHDWERYSTRQHGPMKMGGFVGEVEYSGVDEEFLPVLALGELLHVGTGTTMGLGKFEVSVSRQPRCFRVAQHQVDAQDGSRVRATLKSQISNLRLR